MAGLPSQDKWKAIFQIGLSSFVVKTNYTIIIYINYLKIVIYNSIIKNWNQKNDTYVT